MDWTAFFAIFISLILIGFFSGIEIAFVSASKLSIELRKKQGTFSGRIWSQYADDPARFIGTTLVGFNILLVVYGLLWSSFMYPIWHNNIKIGDINLNVENPYIHLIVETLFSTFVLLIFEFVFKAFFRAKNEMVISSSFITYIVRFFYGLFSWLALFFVNIAEWILKYLFNVKMNVKKDAFTKVDLEYFVQQSKNYDEEDNKEINKELFENALSLSEVKIRECLIPRKEIEGVDIKTNIDVVKNKFVVG